MKTRSNGRHIPLSPLRLFACDMMEFSRRVPLIPFERRMNLAELAAARAACPLRPSWCAIFTKSLAIVSQRMPVLRRAYLSFPYRRLYEHPYAIASVIVERELAGEFGIIHCNIRKPHEKPLREIDGILHLYKTDPLEKHGTARKLLRIARYPRFIRHLGWWYQLNCDGTIRAYNTGTFGVSVTAGHGATALTVATPLTSTLHYGILEPDGSLNCRMTFDHRVMDGGDMARVLVALEGVLAKEMLDEVKNIACNS